MEIKAAQVKELREKTGAGMMDCKKALVEAEGNEEEAIKILREKGILKAAKKSERITAEGLVEIYISDDKKVGAIVEVNSETDFVSKNAQFREFTENVVKQVAKNNPKDVEALLAEKYIDDSTKTVQEVLTDKIATIGENISIRRFERVETQNSLASYIHGDGKIGALLDIKGGDDELGKDICMQIAAAKPLYVNEEDVPEEDVNKEKEVLKAQVINEGRPENVADKIVEGRLGKFYQEICLVDQEYVKDPSQKVGALLKSKGAEVVSFVRFEKGEGLEKREENFAEEVQKQLNQ